MKSNIITFLTFLFLVVNSYYLFSQDAPPSLGLAPQIPEHKIDKVPYNPVSLPNLLASTGYTVDGYVYQWCTLTVPGGVLTSITSLSVLYYGGAYDNVGNFYACTYNPTNLVKISTNGNSTLIGTLGIGTNIPTSLAYVRPNGPLYLGAPSSSLSSCTLYTVNTSTGSATMVAPITNANGLIFMSVDLSGNCYGVDIVADNTIKINLTTGVGTILGPCGINANYAQGGAFELSTGILYWAAYSTLPELRTINLTTGASTVVATIPSGHEPVAFAIPYNPYPCDMQAGPFVSLPINFQTGNAYNIKAKITNVGTAAQTNIPVKFFVNGVQNGATQTIPGLATGAFDTNRIFSWTPTVNGPATLKICSALGCDTLRLNDTVTTTVLVGLPQFFCDYFDNLSNWTITNNGGNCVWQCVPIRTETMPPTSSGNILAADVDLCGSGTTMNTTATLTNSLNCSSFYATYMEFDNDYYILGADHAKMDLSTDGGNTWINKFDWTTNHRTTHETQFLPEADFKPNVKIRFTYVAPGWDWWWAIDNVCIYHGWDGTKNNEKNIPDKYSLSQNYPNPFNPSTVISYQLSKSGNVKLVVFDVLGREVQTLVNEYKPAGTYEVTFDGSSLSSGLYFYRILSGDFSDVKKMMLIK